jgi:hypothetical protein
MPYVNRFTDDVMSTPGDRPLTQAEIEAGWEAAIPVDNAAAQAGVMGPDDARSEPAQRHRPHIVDGEFQSDKYPTTPRGKVPLSVKDPTAQDLLWQYAQRRRSVDAEFADDLETCLRAAGYTPPTSDTTETPDERRGWRHAVNRPTCSVCRADLYWDDTRGSWRCAACVSAKRLPELLAPRPVDEGTARLQLDARAAVERLTAPEARTVVGRLPRLAPVPPPPTVPVTREATPAGATLQDLRAELAQLLLELHRHDPAHKIVKRRLDYIDNAPPGRLDESAARSVVSGMIDWVRRQAVVAESSTPTPDRQPTNASEVKPPSISCHPGRRCTEWPVCEFCGPPRQ